jgi:hypothetical protein
MLLDRVDGVFLPHFRKGGGRPVEAERDAILRTWNEIGRPSFNIYTLAAKFYGTTFERADGPKRKRLRDKCRAAVERALKAQMAAIKSRRVAKELFPDSFPEVD